MNRLLVLLLAAGNSSRLNGSKQLANIKGAPLICHTLSKFYQGSSFPIAGVDDVVVVVGANHEEITDALPPNTNIFYAKTHAQGLGASIAETVKYSHSAYSHVMIALADQVAVSAQDIHLLIKQSVCAPDKIITSSYGCELGVPAIFPSKFIGYLQKLTGDKGAKAIILNNLDETVIVSVPNAQLDIDTQAELQVFLSQ